VIGALGGDHPVARGEAAGRLNALLELALRIARRHVELAEPRQRLRHHGAAERPRGLQPPIEVHGADDRLHGVREHVRLIALARGVGSLPEPEQATEAHGPRPCRERVGVDQEGAHPRQIALVRRREAIHEELGDAETDHRVAEELESLVVAARPAPLLVREARVRERLLEVRQLALEAEAQREVFRQHLRDAEPLAQLS
jgi:hypothetical protein